MTKLMLHDKGDTSFHHSLWAFGKTVPNKEQYQ